MLRHFSTTDSHITKSWWTFLSVLIFVFIPFVFFWIYYGEINLSENNWLIAKNASVWHGTIDESNVILLANKYGMFYNGGSNSLLLDLIKRINKNISINSAYTFFNLWILLILSIFLLFSIVYPIILKLFKISEIDIIPFSFSSSILFFVLIISGIIPHWKQEWFSIYWTIRILISLFICSICFLISNFFIKKWIINHHNSIDIFFAYKKQSNQHNLAYEQLKKNIDIYNAKKGNESFVETTKEEH